MISNDELYRKVAEIEGMVQKSPDLDPGGLPVHEHRIERIIEKASYEAIVKDTAGFLFNSFGTAFVGLTAAVMGHAEGSAPSRETGSGGDIVPFPSQDEAESD